MLKAGKDTAKLIQNHLLHSGVGIQLVARGTDGDTRVTPGGQRHLVLGRQTGASTGSHIIGGDQRHRDVDARQDELEVIHAGTFSVGDRREVHIQPDVIGQVRRARCNQSVSDVHRQIGVDLTIGGERSGGIPCGLRTS